MDQQRAQKNHNSKKCNLYKSEYLFFIRFSTLRIFHENWTISEGGGGEDLHILNWEKK